jgi:hypothetical protein
MLKRIAAFWCEHRLGQIAPGKHIVDELPSDLKTYVLTAYLSTNVSRKWIISQSGLRASRILGIKEGFPLGDGDRRNAARLRRLFKLVAAKEEPYAATFEIKNADGKSKLTEVFAAPLQGQAKTSPIIFAAANSRVEAV